MPKNPGKQFEEDIKRSVPASCWCYRFKDGTANFNGAKNENVRFQAYNICDFMVMSDTTLFLLELKSHKGSSIPFKAIRPKQLEELSKINHKAIKPCFIFNFRDYDKTYVLLAGQVNAYISIADRKSIPIDFCKEFGLEIPQQKKKVNWKYELGELLSNEQCTRS